MVSHSTVRWEGGKVHSSLETGLMEPSYHRVYCSLVPRLPPHGDALEIGLLDHGVVEVTGNNGLVQAVEQDKQGLCEITITRGPSVYHHHL